MDGDVYVPALGRRQRGRRRGVVALALTSAGRLRVGERLLVDGVRPRRVRAGAAVRHRRRLGIHARPRRIRIRTELSGLG